MLKKHFGSALIMLIFIFGMLMANNSFAQFSKTELASSGGVEYTLEIDNQDTHQSENFSLGGYYDFSSYPVTILSKATNTGTSGEKPRVSLYIDGSVDNTNWESKIATIVTSDSVSTWHSFDGNFSKEYPYYRLNVEGEATNPDSVEVKYQLFWKKE